MKKYYFLATVLLFSIFTTQELKAQLKDEVGHTVTQWSNWSTTQCHKGLAWRLRQNFYTGNNNGYTWEYEVKNNYGRQVAFSFKFSEGDESSGTSAGRRTLKANETYRNTALPNASRINYFVYSVCFSNDGRCKDECYSPCDNGTPNIPDCTSSNTSSSNNQQTSSSNNQNRQQTNPPVKSQKQIEYEKTASKLEAAQQGLNAISDIIKTQKQEKAKEKESQIKEQAKQMANKNKENQKTQTNNTTSSNDADKLYERAKIALQEKDLPKYYELVEKSAILGNTEAMVDISNYYRGSYMNQPLDATKADNYLLKAIELGNSRAMYQYGYNYAIGNGVPKDKGQAVKWYLQSAEKGYPNAMYAMGEAYSMYSYREVVQKNLTTAKMWFQKACDLGFERGCADVLRIEKGSY